MKKLLLAVGVLALLVPTLMFVTRAQANPPPWNPDPGQTCYLSVPQDPLSATGLATPYQLSGQGCDEADPDTSAFVQATVLSPTGQVAVYSPLVVNAGQSPAAAPVVPDIAPGSTVGIVFGFNGIYLHLTGPGAWRCVNGLFHISDFGQFAYCNTPDLYRAMNAAVSAGTLTVPPLGTSDIGQTCPTVNSFDIVDQDPNDNVQTKYLTGNDYFAQDTAANRALFPAATVVANPSDNALMTEFVDPAIGCTPWTAPDLADPGSSVPSEVLDQFQARADQGGPVAWLNLDDEMTLINGSENVWKNDIYRAGIDEPPVSRWAPGDDLYYCSGLAHNFPAWLTANQTALSAQPSPAPGYTNLWTFMAGRFVATYEMQLPSPGVVPTCDQVTGIDDPVTLNTEVVGATVTVP